MLVYQKTKSAFQQDMLAQTVPMQLKESFIAKGLITPSPSEFQSWQNSLTFMSMVLSTPTIPDDCGVAIEYCIPISGKRVDFIISGFLDVNGSRHRTAIIIELKQWSSVEPAENLNGVVRVRTKLGGKLREMPHPSYQAWSYAQLISQFNEAVEVHRIGLHPCAFLHNYLKVANDPLLGERYHEVLAKAPAYCSGDIAQLRDFIQERITHPDQGRVMEEIAAGKIRPAKSLQDALAGLLKGNEEFVLVDDQKVVLERARHLAKEAVSSARKKVLVVRGGPGTGKSVVAVNLLVRLTQDGMLCKYVSKNSAPRNVYATRLVGKAYTKAYINGLFCSSGSFLDAQKNSFHALIVDEAHRLNEKSGLYGNQGENQTKELIHAARFTLFFLDDAQRVTLRDAGSMAEIEKWAGLAGAELTVLDLTSQFRCNGSQEYITWLDRFLGIPMEEVEATEDAAIRYDFRVFDDPCEMAAEIEALNKWNNRSRLVAGYCWDWKTAGKNNPDYADIVLPEWGFARSWNLGSTPTWAIDDASVAQVGCVHTCQGLEFDYVGVIIGDDLRFEEGRVVADPSRRARTDQSVKGLKALAKAAPEEARVRGEEIVRNTYRVLMTRGQLGCFVFCTDKALGEHLKALAGRILG